MRRTRAATLLLSLLFAASLLPSLPASPLAPATALAGCSVSVIDPTTGQVICDGVDIGPPGNPAPSTVSNCFAAGNWNFLTPRAATTPFAALWGGNNMLVESGANLSSADDFYSSMRFAVGTAMGAAGLNTESFWWGGPLGVADMMAAALQISPNPGWSSPILNFSTSWRNSMINGNAQTSIVSGSFEVISIPPSSPHVPDSGVKVLQILDNSGRQANQAFVRPASGTPTLAYYPTVPQAYPSLPNAPLSQATIMAWVNSVLGGVIGDGNWKLADHINPGGGIALPQVYKNAVAASYVPGFAIDIYYYDSVSYPARWTKVVPGAWLPVGAFWTARVTVPNRTKSIYGSNAAQGDATVLAAFHQVVRDQLSVGLTTKGKYLGRTVVKGRYFVPEFAYTGYAGQPGGCSYGASRHTFKIGNLTIRRFNTAGNPTTSDASNQGCYMGSITTKAQYNARITNPNACWMYWRQYTLTPPPLTGWSNTAQGFMTSVIPALPGGSNTAAATIGQAIHVTVDPFAPLKTSTTFAVSAATSGGVGNTTVNITQLGITATVGNDTMIARKINWANPSAGYSFDIAFPRTPSSRLQDAECINAWKTSAVQLEKVCGIEFRATAAGTVPVYRVRLHTWYGGAYNAPSVGAGYYCGLFRASPSAGKPCAIIPAALFGDIVEWPTAGVGNALGATVFFDGANRNVAGTSLGWSGAMSETWPNSAGTAYDGAPIYDVSGNTSGTAPMPGTSVWISVTQSQPIP